MASCPPGELPEGLGPESRRAGGSGSSSVCRSRGLNAPQCRMVVSSSSAGAEPWPDVLIGADGLHSACRAHMQGSFDSPFATTG